MTRTVLDVTEKGVVQTEPERSDPEALFREARRRRRQRWSLAGLVPLAICGAIAVGLASSQGSGNGRTGSAGIGSAGTHAPAVPVSPPTVPSGSSSLCPQGSSSTNTAACTVAGIAASEQSSELFGWTFDVTNAYTGIYANQRITVFAGAVLTPDPTGRTAHGMPNGGGVRIAMGTPSASTKQFLLPGTLGPLTITAVNDGILTLQRPDGTRVMFDLATDIYS